MYDLKILFSGVCWSRTTSPFGTSGI